MLDATLRDGLVEHYRSALIDDASLILFLGDGPMTGEAVRKIGGVYRVSRNIPRFERNDLENYTERKDKNAELVAAEIERLVQSIRENSLNDNLLGKAKLCASTSSSLKAGFARRSDEKVEPRYVDSAVTKLLWFRFSECWTLFDRFAERAVGAKAVKAERAIHAFYRELESRGFKRISDTIDEVLKDPRYRMQGDIKLHGGRVIDKFLMLRGADPRWSGRILEANSAFMLGIEPEARNRINSIATEIERLMEERGFDALSLLGNRKRRRRKGNA